MVSDSWSVGWGEYLVTSRRVIYASIDGRGTGFQSDEHLFQVIFSNNITDISSDDRYTETWALWRSRTRSLSPGSWSTPILLWMRRGLLSGAGPMEALPQP